jgi:hypothetical protein
MSGVTTSTRTVKEFRVNINEECVPCGNSYAAQITILKEAIEAQPSDAKTCEMTKHPLLHVSSVFIPMSLSNDIHKKMYGKGKARNKAFLQLLTYLGMRFNIDKKTQVRTLTGSTLTSGIGWDIASSGAVTHNAINTKGSNLKSSICRASRQKT